MSFSQNVTQFHRIENSVGKEGRMLALPSRKFQLQHSTIQCLFNKRSLSRCYVLCTGLGNEMGNEQGIVDNLVRKHISKQIISSKINYIFEIMIHLHIFKIKKY